jgi:hypothetical protein
VHPLCGRTATTGAGSTAGKSPAQSSTGGVVGGGVVGGGVVVAAANCAVTAVSALSITVQEPVPEQEPDQPEKAWPDAAVAVSTTEVPWVNDMLQVEPQSIPAGFELTDPLPSSVTVSIAVGELASGPPLPGLLEDIEPPQANAQVMQATAPSLAQSCICNPPRETFGLLLQPCKSHRHDAAPRACPLS